MRSRPAWLMALCVRRPNRWRSMGGSWLGDEVDVEADLVFVADRPEERAVWPVPEARLEKSQCRAPAQHPALDGDGRRERDFSRHVADRETAGDPQLAFALGDDAGGREANGRIARDIQLVGGAHRLGHVRAFTLGGLALDSEPLTRGRLVD